MADDAAAVTVLTRERSSDAALRAASGDAMSGASLAAPFGSAPSGSAAAGVVSIAAASEATNRPTISPGTTSSETMYPELTEGAKAPSREATVDLSLGGSAARPSLMAAAVISHGPTTPLGADQRRSPGSGPWLSAGFALLALCAAAVALTAPALRPILVEKTPAWLGGGSNGLAPFLTPENPTDRVVEDLVPRLVALEADVMRLRMELGRLGQRTQETELRIIDSQRDGAAAMHAAQDAARRAQAMQVAGQALSDRVRAATMLAAATRLRRDIDAGAPLADAIALLAVNGPHAEPVAAALEILNRNPDGVATMRDLALGFDSLDQMILIELGHDGSAWSRIRALFGSADDLRVSFLERVRGLATEGRMAEVATLLSHSPWNEQAAPWIARAKARTDVARASHVISAYALTAAQGDRRTAEPARP